MSAAYVDTTNNSKTNLAMFSTESTCNPHKNKFSGKGIQDTTRQQTGNFQPHTHTHTLAHPHPSSIGHTAMSHINRIWPLHASNYDGNMLKVLVLRA